MAQAWQYGILNTIELLLSEDNCHGSHGEIFNSYLRLTWSTAKVEGNMCNNHIVPTTKWSQCPLRNRDCELLFKRIIHRTTRFTYSLNSLNSLICSLSRASCNLTYHTQLKVHAHSLRYSFNIQTSSSMSSRFQATNRFSSVDIRVTSQEELVDGHDNIR